MAIVPQTFSCDVCKAVKGPTNHWWMIELGVLDDHEKYRPYVLGMFMVTPWGSYSAELEGHLHLCGQECLLKKVAEIVSKQSTIPAPKTSPKVVDSNEDKTE